MELVSLTLGAVQVQAALDRARGLLVLFEADVQVAGGTYQPREAHTTRRYRAPRQPLHGCVGKHQPLQQQCPGCWHRPFRQRTWPISFPRRLRANCSRAGSARCFCKSVCPFACPPGVVVALLSPASPSDFASLAAVLAPSRKQLRAGSR